MLTTAHIGDIAQGVCVKKHLCHRFDLFGTACRSHRTGVCADKQTHNI